MEQTQIMLNAFNELSQQLQQNTQVLLDAMQQNTQVILDTLNQNTQLILDGIKSETLNNDLKNLAREFRNLMIGKDGMLYEMKLTLQLLEAYNNETVHDMKTITNDVGTFDRTADFAKFRFVEQIIH